jgi:hypothetical protein
VRTLGIERESERPDDGVKQHARRLSSRAQRSNKEKMVHAKARRRKGLPPLLRAFAPLREKSSFRAASHRGTLPG